jgi:hypothetical protein
MAKALSFDAIYYESSRELSLDSCELQQRSEADPVGRALAGDSGEGLVAGVESVNCAGGHLRLDCVNEDRRIAFVKAIQHTGYLAVQFDNLDPGQREFPQQPDSR